MKYPVVFRGKSYTVTLQKKYDDIFMTEYILAKIYKGKLHWPFYLYSTMMDIQEYDDKYIKAIKEAMHRYAYCVLDPENQRDINLKALNEWDGIVKEKIDEKIED